MRMFIFSIIMSFCGISVAQTDYYNSKWINDTIYFNSRNLVLTLPEKSVDYSTEYIFKGEGKGFCYPLRISFNDEGGWHGEVLMLDQIVNTSYNRLISTDDFDIELWNTFNMDHMGSRCFLHGGFYSRIDVLPAGVVIYYENLSPEMAGIANRIIKSIRTRTNGSIDESTSKRKRREQIVE